jgi:hypothetical protein
VEGTSVVKDVIELCAALFGMEPASSVLLFNSRILDKNATFGASGVAEGDLLLIMSAPSPSQQQQLAPTQRTLPATSGGGLDFSSLLGGGGGGGGGLNLIPNIQRASSNAVKHIQFQTYIFKICLDISLHLTVQSS